MLVVSMKRQAGWSQSLLVALPRLILAVLLGAVISMPLVLQVFQSEIDAELEVMRREAVAEAQVALDTNERYARIPGLQQQVAQLIPRTLGNVDADPEVARLAQELGTKEQEFREAELALQCERDGRPDCGSGTAGDGPRSAEKADRVERLRGEAAALREQYDAATAAAQERIRTGGDAATEAARAELAAAQADLTAIQEEKTAAERAVVSAEAGNRGLSARLEALHRLGGSNPTLGAAHLALFLLFAAVEVLPVLSKLLTELGPKTLYERLAESREERTFASESETSAQDQRISDMQADLRVRLEQERADAQVEIQRRANERLIERQEAISARAIDTWAEVASRHTDAELAAWYARYSTAPTGTPRSGNGRPVREAVPYAEYMARQQEQSPRYGAPPSTGSDGHRG